jgi:hypothetical protein
MIVRAIAAEVAPVSRIVMRDAQSYCAVLFDDNNRKPIIRLHFNSKQKFVTTFESGKDGARRDLSGIEDLFSVRDSILSVLRSYFVIARRDSPRTTEPCANTAPGVGRHPDRGFAGFPSPERRVASRLWRAPPTTLRVVPPPQRCAPRRERHRGRGPFPPPNRVCL